MKLVKLLLLASTIILPFISGLIFPENNLLNKAAALALLCVAIIALTANEMLTNAIEGDGIKKISVGSEAPKKPSNGDMWVDTSETESPHRH